MAPTQTYYVSCLLNSPKYKIDFITIIIIVIIHFIISLLFYLKFTSEGIRALMKNLYDIKFTFIINMKNVTIYHRIVFNMFIFLISFLNINQKYHWILLKDCNLRHFLQPSMLASSFWGWKVQSEISYIVCWIAFFCLVKNYIERGKSFRKHTNNGAL